jgi:hypothetical protein
MQCRDSRSFYRVCKLNIVWSPVTRDNSIAPPILAMRVAPKCQLVLHEGRRLSQDEGEFLCSQLEK